MPADLTGGGADDGMPPSFAALVGRLRAAGCVFAEDEAALLLEAAPGPRELAELVDRRVAGAPLEQVLGWAQFCGLRILVEPGVFVPRRRTELLVEQALVLRPRVVLDLCCGSGAVGAAVAQALGSVELHAADVEPAAVRCARRNVEPFDGAVYEGDLYRPLPDGLRGRVDALVVNAPYVPTDAIATMPPEARLHEPRVALDGGADGLDVQRRVTAEAARWLSPAGHLLMETSERQAALTVAAFTESGLTARVVRSQDLDATVVVGTVGARAVLTSEASRSQRTRSVGRLAAVTGHRCTPPLRLVRHDAGPETGGAGALVQVPDGEPGTLWRCDCGVRWQVYAGQADDGEVSALHRFWALASARSPGADHGAGRESDREPRRRPWLFGRS